VQRFLRISKEKSPEAVVWSDFSNFNSIHVNDSSTALAPIELFRILIDEELLPWDEAFRIVLDCTTFT